jgi:hypothetical protein
MSIRYIDRLPIVQAHNREVTMATALFIGGPNDGEVRCLTKLPRRFAVHCFDESGRNYRDRFRVGEYYLLTLRGERQNHHVFIFEGLTCDATLELLIANYRPLPAIEAKRLGDPRRGRPLPVRTPEQRQSIVDKIKALIHDGQFKPQPKASRTGQPAEESDGGDEPIIVNG